MVLSLSRSRPCAAPSIQVNPRDKHLRDQQSKEALTATMPYAVVRTALKRTEQHRTALNCEGSPASIGSREADWARTFVHASLGNQQHEGNT